MVSDLFFNFQRMSTYNVISSGHKLYNYYFVMAMLCKMKRAHRQQQQKFYVIYLLTFYLITVKKNNTSGKYLIKLGLIVNLNYFNLITGLQLFYLTLFSK